MVMREETPCRLSRQVLAAVGVLALLVIPAWTLGQVAPQPTPAAPPPVKVEEKPAPEAAIQLLNKYLITTVEPQQGSQPGNASPDRDKKLDDLEKKLKDLLKELQALKSGGNPGAATPPAEHRVPPGAKTEYHVVPTTTYQLRQANGNMYYEPVTSYVQWANATQPGGEGKPAEVVLTRATYKLPAAKAQALGAFLHEHVKASVMETKVEGENLIVTTTPEAQHTIAAFIALVQGKAPAAHNWFAPPTVSPSPYTAPQAAPAPAAQPVQPPLPASRPAPVAPSTQPVPPGSPTPGVSEIRTAPAKP
jgi:hypothetical protein